MKTESFDLIVIGAGSAARAAAGKASDEHDARIAMIESVRWGGSCPNVACRPTKAYLVAAELMHDVNTLAETIGIEVGPARANLARIKARKDAIRSTQEQWRERLTGAGYTLVDGVASFDDAGTVRVGDRLLTAERILIATGSRTAVPPVEGIGDIDWLDHVSALELIRAAGILARRRRRRRRARVRPGLRPVRVTNHDRGRRRPHRVPRRP